MSARDVICNYFDDHYGDTDLFSLIGYLDTDTLVSWFVDEGYVDCLDSCDEKIVMEHYDLHCGR